MAGVNTIQRGGIGGLSLNVRVETDLIVWTSGLTTPEIKQAINRAINYATKRAKTRIKRMVTTEYNLKSSMVGNDAIKRVPSSTARLTGYVYAASRPESLGHFGPTEYKPTSSGTVKTKKGAHYSSTKLKGKSSRSGIYFSVVKGKTERLPGAWLWFSGSMPIVMGRGKYDQNTGKTKAFLWGKPRYPISKINTKSVYWGVLHPKTINLWSPETQTDYLNELNRQCQVILKMRP